LESHSKKNVVRDGNCMYRAASLALYNTQPLEPQPTKGDVVTLIRNTSTLAASSKYKRRVTWLECNAQRKYDALAVVEYFGTHVTGARHDRCKDPQAEEAYVRDRRNDTAATRADDNQCSLYNNLIVDLDCDTAPQNSRVVPNRKFADDRKIREAAGFTTCHNFTDEFQFVFNLVQTEKALGADCFLRYCTAAGCRLSSVILYIERQIHEPKYFCFLGPAVSVISFDKTYNLGEVHVTGAVYKNLAVSRLTYTLAAFAGFNLVRILCV
jgi:hypothetical protein